MSQPCRFMHDFTCIWLQRRRGEPPGFDGILNWIGGASGGFFNYRFAQPGRTHRQHIGRWYPERQFPFANSVIHDPVTGLTDGRLSRCLQNGTCPNIFEVNSENEYWAKAGSLLHTDTAGHDLPDSANVRHYLLASLPHSRGRGPTGRGICQQPQNPLTATRSLRALLVNLDDWVTQGKEPPDQPRPARREWDPCAAAAPVRRRVSSDPRHRLQRPTARRRPLRLRGFVRHGRLERRAASPRRRRRIRRSCRKRMPMATTSPASGPSTSKCRSRRYTGWALRAGSAAGDGCDAWGQQIDLPERRPNVPRTATRDCQSKSGTRHTTTTSPGSRRLPTS